MRFNNTGIPTAEPAVRISWSILNGLIRVCKCLDDKCFNFGLRGEKQDTGTIVAPNVADVPESSVQKRLPS